MGYISSYLHAVCLCKYNTCPLSGHLLCSADNAERGQKTRMREKDNACRGSVILLCLTDDITFKKQINV